MGPSPVLRGGLAPSHMRSFCLLCRIYQSTPFFESQDTSCHASRPVVTRLSAGHLPAYLAPKFLPPSPSHVWLLVSGSHGRCCCCRRWRTPHRHPPPPTINHLHPGSVASIHLHPPPPASNRRDNASNPSPSNSIPPHPLHLPHAPARSRAARAYATPDQRPALWRTLARARAHVLAARLARPRASRACARARRPLAPRAPACAPPVCARSELARARIPARRPSDASSGRR